MDDAIPATRPQSALFEHERLRSLINSMADGVVAIDKQGKIVLYNGAALNILDSNASMKGKSISRIAKLVDHNNQPVDLRKMIFDTKTATITRDYRLQYPDGSLINLYLSIAPVHLGYSQDGLNGYVLLLRDITREKSLEEERNEFISVASHELRTPITVAEGNIGNALFIAEHTGNQDADIMDALKQAHNQIAYLASLINDLATLSRADRGKLQVEVGNINVHDLILELQKNYTPQAEQKGLKVKVDIDPSLEILKSSHLYVREVLQNFITNAIKYTEKGSVTIGADQMEKGVKVWVHDTGIGISKSDQERVWDKFFRSEDFRTRQNSGTGLGLYVTMKLARLLHAEVDLESALNKGSTFTVFIPNLK